MTPEPITSRTSRRYDEALERLRAQVLHMGGIVEENLRSAIEAIVTGDSEKGLEVSKADEKINALEVEIDEHSRNLLATRAPSAGDLRLVFVVIKAITELERIGDEAKRIGVLAASLAAQSRERSRYGELTALASHVQRMLSEVLDAFSRGDARYALAVIKQDKRVDAEYENFARRCVGMMMEDAQGVQRFIDLSWVARRLERIGDHATNIAEYVVYLVHGADIRHTSMREALKRVESKTDSAGAP